MDFFTTMLPQQFQRITVRFVLEVAFSVAVTLAATKIISYAVSVPEAPKTNLRAQVLPVSPAWNTPAKGKADGDAATTAPDLSAFMERTAMAHMAKSASLPWSEETGAKEASNGSPAQGAGASAVTRVSPAIVAAAPREARPALLDKRDAVLASLPPPTSVPSRLVSVAAAPRPAAGDPLVISAPVSVPATLSAARRADPVLRPPADIVDRRPAPAKDNRNLLTKIGDAVPGKDLVTGVGNSIGQTVGGWFKRD